MPLFRTLDALISRLPRSVASRGKSALFRAMAWPMTLETRAHCHFYHSPLPSVRSNRNESIRRRRLHFQLRLRHVDPRSDKHSTSGRSDGICSIRRKGRQIDRHHLPHHVLGSLRFLHSGRRSPSDLSHDTCSTRWKDLLHLRRLETCLSKHGHHRPEQTCQLGRRWDMS